MTRRRWGSIALLFGLLMVEPRAASQSPFMNVMPGVSTKDDAARLLGQPVRTVRSGVIEYPPPAGLAKVEVHFDSRNRVQRMDVYLQQPVTRRAIAERFGLPERHSGTKEIGGKLVEYYGEALLLSLTYAGADEASGVAIVGHHSRAEFETHIPPEDTFPITQPGGRVLDHPVVGQGSTVTRKRLTAWKFNDGVGLEGTRLAYYTVTGVEKCEADCADNASCKAFTVIRAGTYNAADPAMCYLMSSVTKAVKAVGHYSGVKQ